jgi:hypothetical protein
MNHLPKTLLAAALVLPLIGGTGEAAVWGCSHTLSGLRVPPYTGSLMVDGILLGESPGVDRTFPEDVEFVDEDILHTWVGCLEIERDSNTVGVRVVALVTKGGAVGFMRSYLEDLIEAQEEYRTAAGAFAQGVAELRFLVSHPRLPIETIVADGHWTATIRLERDEMSCQGSAVMHGDQSSSPEIAVRCQ